MDYQPESLARYLIIVALLLITPQFARAQAAPQTPKSSGKSVFTNDDFPTGPKSSAATGETSAASDSSSSSEGGQVQGLDLKFRLLDLELQSASQPDNRDIRDEIIRVKSQIKEAPLAPATSADLRDLKFHERFIELKIAIVEAEAEAQDASSNIQAKRRKVLIGKKTKKARKTMQAVRDAQQQAAQEQDEVEVLKAELDALLEEGRQAGAGPRAFR